jgi:aldose sugar dehydrogenase
VNSNLTKKKSIRNYYSIWYKVSIPLLISIILVCSSFYVLPSVFSSNGTLITQWGEYGHRDGRMRYPEGIAVDSSSGYVYVADTGNSRILVFSSNGTLITQWGEYGGDRDGRMRYPEGIALDQEGNVYVADTGNNRVNIFSSNGTFISQWGQSGRQGQRAGQLMHPEGIAVDSSSGYVYVADTGNNRISVFASRLAIGNVAFSSQEGDIYGNDRRIKIEPVYEGLSIPAAIGFLGPNDMLVFERQNSTIMRIVNGQMLDEPVLDLGNSTKIRGCMCGIAISRNDNSTSYAFVYYSQAEVTQENGTRKLVNSLYRYDIDNNGKFTNPRLLFEMPSSLEDVHHGGKLVIGPDKNVYLTTGDIDGQRETKAQNIKNGSLPDGSSGILRFTQDGEPVGGGLLGHSPALDNYYAYGIRNSFGIDFDPVTGNIWITDNGPAYGDELNLVRPGFNGGWKKVMGFSSFDKAFNLTDLEFFNDKGKYYDPVFEWFTSIGVTDLVFVSSDKLGKEYEGNLFVGDINSGYLYRFLVNQSRTGLLLNGSLSDGVANNNEERLEAVFARIEGGITDLEIGPDGLVYIVSGNGKIMRLEPRPS